MVVFAIPTPPKVCFSLLKSLEDAHILEGEEGGLKRKWGELNFKQVAPIAHRIDRLLMCGGDFSPPTTAIVSLQQGISCVHLMYFPRFARVFSRLAMLCFPNFPGLQLRISLSLVVTLFAASILEPLKRLCCLVSPFKSPNPAGLYQV